MENDNPTLEQINIIGSDLERSRDFYRMLGVSLPDPFRDPAGNPFHVGDERALGVHIDLDSPAFAQFWNKGWAGRRDLPGRVVLGFRVGSREAVDGTYDALVAAGHRGLQPPYDAFWGARYAVVEDPDGIAVGLMSPIDETKKGPPEGWSG
jgi:catechol 2,3-dioxygenase-like lactoylglutathione lyase family enzyme